MLGVLSNRAQIKDQLAYMANFSMDKIVDPKSGILCTHFIAASIDDWSCNVRRAHCEFVIEFPRRRGRLVRFATFIWHSNIDLYLVTSWM